MPMPTDTPDPNRYCPECERWRSPKPYCPECKCKTRDATEEELTGAEKPDGSLAFGRYVVEGGKAYEVRDLIDEGCWLKDGDVEIDASKVKRPLPSTPATYALLQAAWVEHFRVKVGTRVKIAREWSEKGDLSVIHPHYEMLNMVGSEQFVKEIDPGGVKLEDWWFPFHVLTVLPEPAEARERAVETAHADPDDRPFFVDERAGCIGIRERAKTDPGYQGLHHDTKGVVWYRHGERNGSEWVVDSRHVDEANRLCAQMNAGAAKANELAAIRTNNVALAATVAGMREAFPVNDEPVEAVALLETICGQEIQKMAGVAPGGRSTMELAEAAIALIAEKQRREGGSDG